MATIARTRSTPRMIEPVIKAGYNPHSLQIVRWWFDQDDSPRIQSIAESISPLAWQADWTMREMRVLFTLRNVIAAGCNNADQFVSDLDRIVERATR